jgi:indole-3-glycerol phosphate synthase
VERPAPPSLSAALRRGERIAVIAEYKRRSPSAGALAHGEDPVAVARAYRDAGAAAMSVLTDPVHFDGRLEDLEEAAGAVGGGAGLAPGGKASLPLLRKDFIVDAGQLFEARLAGASAALLIAGILSDEELASLLAAAAGVGLECLVEVHTEEEMERTVAAGASIVGINNRDLRRLVTDLGVTDALAPLAPAGAVVVSESGIREADDVRRVRDAGAHAVLVGEALLRHPPHERSALLRALAGVER